VGAFAVVVSLAYLAIQIRQNTKAARAQIHQSRSDQAQDFFLFGAGSREFAEIWAKVDNDPEKLSALDDAERIQLQFWTVAERQRVQNMFFQMKTGFLSPELYMNQEKVIRRRIPLWDALGMLDLDDEFSRELERIRHEMNDH